MLSVVQTGDSHIAIFDFQNDAVFVSNALLTGSTAGNYTATAAYDGIYTRLNMTALFAEEKPMMDLDSDMADLEYFLEP